MIKSRSLGAVCTCVLSLCLSFESSAYNIIDLGTLGGTFSRGDAINASGQVTGDSQITGDSASHAFLYDGSTMQDLGTLGGTHSYGYGMNDSGHVVGMSYLAGDSARHAFLYDGSTMQDLGTLGGRISYGRSINASGQVVGNSLLASGSQYVAYLYDGSSMLDLCVLVDCVGAGWDFFTDARAINDQGDITGYGVINGETHAFLISSVPIPAAIWLFGSGLLGLIGIARRKKA